MRQEQEIGSSSAERKEPALRRMRPPESLHIPVLAKETGIPEATLYRWRKRALEQAGLSSDHEPSSTWSAADKLSVVVEMASLNEHELGEYCRRKGLYAEQVSQWREKCLSARENPGPVLDFTF
jgi:transposase